MSRKKKIIISALVITTAILGSFYILLFSNSNYKLTAKPSIESYDTFMDAKYAKTTAKLNEDELNSILSMVFKNGITEGDITVYGLEAKILSSEIYLSSPISFRGIRLLVSASGTINDDGSDKIIFNPTLMKIGKIKLPVNFILSKLKGNKISYFQFTSNSIIINKSSFSFDIKNVSLADNEIIINFENEKLPSKESTPVNNNVSKEKPDNKTGNVKTKSPVKSNVSKAKLSPIWEKDLKKLSSQLTSAIKLVTGDKEKDILIRIKDSVDKKIADTSYDITKDAASVTSSYAALAIDERNQIKGAILAAVDLENAMNLREIFGI